ncbi:MAG: DNA gyrase inhibitor YacG [Sphingomonadales bacterium]|nr:MAG: DNA gyrase inhibitor YacG [Sphingomonadales bacterium]
MAKNNGCPICGQPPTSEFKPFCSRGCKDRDLLQWLGEGYRVPGEPVDPEAFTGLDSDRDPD